MPRRPLLAAGLAALLLAGCTINLHRGRCEPCEYSPGKGDPANPTVQVVDGEIAIDQEVLRFGKDQVNVTITWRLPKGYTFPQNGIVFERRAADEITGCRRLENPAEFSCLNKHTRTGKYKYGVNVNEGDKPLKPLDPYVWND